MLGRRELRSSCCTRDVNVRRWRGRSRNYGVVWEITEGQRKTKKDVSSSFIYPQSDNDGPDLRFVTCTVSRADEAC